MKTITFQGDEKHIIAISNFNKNICIVSDNLIKVETRVYVLEIDDLEERHHSELTDLEFMTLAEEKGRVYTLKGFQDAFNGEEINSAIDFIRFINITI